MTEIKPEKRFPHIPDEDVTRIFQDGYMKGWEDARKKAIPIEWIKKWCNEHNRKSLEERLLKRYGVITMLEDWEKENEKDI